jgi:hypothetical protein
MAGLDVQAAINNQQSTITSTASHYLRHIPSARFLRYI